MNDKKNLSVEQVLEDIMNLLPLPEAAKESSNEFIKLRKEMLKESDRGLALYATAHIDNELETILRDKLVGNANHLNDVFSFNGPLGIFSSKIKLSYSLGLISKITMNDINTLRKIRNEFAHSNQSLSFESEKIRNLCDGLQLNVQPENSSSRIKFMNVVSGISGLLYGANMKFEKFEELESINLEERKTGFDSLLNYSKNLLHPTTENNL